MSKFKLVRVNRGYSTEGYRFQRSNYDRKYDDPFDEYPPMKLKAIKRRLLTLMVLVEKEELRLACTVEKENGR